MRIVAIIFILIFTLDGFCQEQRAPFLNYVEEEYLDTVLLSAKYTHYLINKPQGFIKGSYPEWRPTGSVQFDSTSRIKCVEYEKIEYDMTAIRIFEDSVYFSYNQEQIDRPSVNYKYKLTRVKVEEFKNTIISKKLKKYLNTGHKLGQYSYNVGLKNCVGTSYDSIVSIVDITEKIPLLTAVYSKDRRSLVERGFCTVTYLESSTNEKLRINSEQSSVIYLDKSLNWSDFQIKHFYKYFFDYLNNKEELKCIESRFSGRVDYLSFWKNSLYENIKRVGNCD